MIHTYRNIVPLREIADAGGSYSDAAAQLSMTRGAVAGLAARCGIKFTAVARGERNSKARLTSHQVLEIRRRFETELGKNLADEFGIKLSTIYSIVQGKCWKHLPLTQASSSPTGSRTHRGRG